jgi:uncharacterized protein involved in exopolysaccharide biosynthesis
MFIVVIVVVVLAAAAAAAAATAAFSFQSLVLLNVRGALSADESCKLIDLRTSVT